MSIIFLNCNAKTFSIIPHTFLIFTGNNTLKIFSKISAPSTVQTLKKQLSVLYLKQCKSEKI